MGVDRGPDRHPYEKLMGVCIIANGRLRWTLWRFNAEINHQRHFIKIPFINKGMDFIELPSIFRINLLLHQYLITSQDSEPPII